MVKKIEDFINLSDPNIPEQVRIMIKKLPEKGKQALTAYCDKDSDFSQHAQLGNLAKKFLLDTDLDNNKVIYHYTSVESLKKILNSRTFLIKEKSYMNDPEEGSYAFNLAIDELKQMSATRQEIDFFRDKARSRPFNDVYIWSFTRNGESQALFGNYNGDSHDGVALEFDAQTIQEKLVMQFSRGMKDLDMYTTGNAYVFPLNVVYEEGEQQAYLRPVMNEWLMAYRSFTYDRHDMEEILTACLKALSLLAMCFKNPVLRQEEEVRFLVINIDKDNEKHPDVEIGHTPFMKCEFTPTMLKSITLQTNGITKIDQLKNVVSEYGFGQIEVRQSALPY